MQQSNVIKPASFADADNGVRHVFVRDLELGCMIGVHEHEQHGPQRILVNIDLSVRESGADIDDRLANVVCYETIVGDIKRICERGHVNLVETLAEEIASACLRDTRVSKARVRVEKLDVIPEAAGVGVEIERNNPPA